MLDSAQTLALMTAITRLRHFTAEEIAMHAGVPLAATRNFLERREWADIILKPGSNSERPRRTTWAVLPQRVDALAQAVVGLRKAQTDRAVARRARVNLAETLAIALDAIEEGRRRSEDVSREIASARRFLRGFETATWDRQLEFENDLAPDFVMLAALRVRCAELGLAGDAAPVGADSPSVAALGRALLDWTVAMPSSLHAGEQLAPWVAPGASAAELAGSVFRGVAGAAIEDSRAIFLPALRAISIVEANPRDPAIRARLLEVAQRAMKQPHAAHLVPAACLLLAALDAPEAVDCVLPALVKVEEGAVTTEHALTCAALARLARPDEHGRVRTPAARACLFLLPQASTEIARLLAPGALCAAYADPMSILEQLVIPQPGEEQPMGVGFDAGAFVRTLAVAMFSLRQSSAGADLVERLASTTRGTELLELVSDPQYRALIVRPDDEAGYVMRPAGHLYSVVLPESALVVSRLARQETLALMNRLSVASAGDSTLAPKPLTSRLSSRKPAARNLAKVDWS